MTQRFTIDDAHPAIKAMYDVEKHLRDSSLEHSLQELVKMRASQINGCAFCLDMHSKDARQNGESEQRLYTLNAWHETPFFSDRERAALAWTESVTRVAQTQVPDAVYQQARQQFSEAELLDLTLAVSAINFWNRLAVGSRRDVGTYRPDLAG